MSVSLQHTKRLIKEIFPGASTPPHQSPSLQGSFVSQIGSHVLVIKPDLANNIGRLEWRAGGRRAFDLEKASTLDSFRPQTEADLIGWLSYTSQSICHLAKIAIAHKMNPLDLFPEGYHNNHAVQAMMQNSIEVLQQCGKEKDDIVREVGDCIRVNWIVNAERSSVLFYVNNVDRGKVGGRIAPQPNFSENDALQWGYKFSLGTTCLKRRGGTSFAAGNSSFPTVSNDSLEKAKEFLIRKYVKAIFDELNILGQTNTSVSITFD